MSAFTDRLQYLEFKKKDAQIRVLTLGTFEVFENGRFISSKAWGRDKTLQLFQFFITSRHRRSLHKEQIIDRLWEETASIDGDRDFKVALHGIHKVLEPDRAPRTEPKYIIRQGVSYQLNHEYIWIDAQALEEYVKLGNEAVSTEITTASSAYRAALDLYKGTYLPDRSFYDWTSEERERLHVLVLSAYLSLAELLLEVHPLETVRLTQAAILLDNTWEDAYQLQMKAFLAKGNRPAAIKVYHRCVAILDKEFGLDPLPETQHIFDTIV